ncbi:MAG: hypothetical protein KA100_02105 [Rickettsiales bacterium]|nr:hypothetical protein [Rickettsiales bacterium]
MNQLLGMIGVAALLLFGVLQLYAGYIGIDYHFGSIWAFIAVTLAIVFRFTLPITIGAFFGAIDVWNWHWLLASLFVAPGLVFIVPGVFIIITSKIMGSIRREKNPHHITTNPDHSE